MPDSSLQHNTLTSRAAILGASLALCASVLQAAAPTNRVEPRDEFILTFCGDTGFGEFYESNDLENTGKHILDTRGYDYGFEAVRPLIEDSDLLLINLETAVTDQKHSPLDGQKGYLHGASMTLAPPTIVRQNVDVVSLANNHTLDFGREGLTDTFDALEDAGIHALGAGDSLDAAQAPFVTTVELGDITQRIVILAGFEHSLKYQFQYDFYADETRSGVNPWTASLAADQVRAARDKYPDAIIIAFPHWGSNYKWATKQQRELAEALAEAGCDLIVGHGAHMLQEVERINNTLVIFGIGNFVFNSPGRYLTDGCVPYSLVAQLSLTRERNDVVGSIRLYPILSDNLKTNYQPRPVDQFEALVAATEIVSKIRHDPDTAGAIRPELDGRGWCFRVDAFRKPLPAGASAMSTDPTH